MKKVVLASDGQYFPKGAFEYAKQLQQDEPILLVGAFLHAVNFEEFLPGLFAVYAGPVETLLETKQVEYDRNVKHFAELCQRSGIEYRIHEESKHWNIGDLIRETRFADMMLMSEELFCTDMNAAEPNSFMQQVIHKAECPVMLLPEDFKSFSKIIFAYNGDKDSMFALKQFCSLLPQYARNEVKIVYIRHESTDNIPDLAYLEEYAGRHFSNLNIEKLAFKGNKYFSSWVKQETDSLVVSGSFGRSGVSTLFSKSFIEDIIKDHQAPLFIGHC